VRHVPSGGVCLFITFVYSVKTNKPQVEALMITYYEELLFYVD